MEPLAPGERSRAQWEVTDIVFGRTFSWKTTKSDERQGKMCEESRAEREREDHERERERIMREREIS